MQKENNINICLYCNCEYDLDDYLADDDYCNECHEKLFGRDHE